MSAVEPTKSQHDKTGDRKLLEKRKPWQQRGDAALGNFFRGGASVWIANKLC